MIHATSRSWQQSRTVLIVDDHPVIRCGVRALIESASDHTVIGEAGDGFEAIELAETLAPDVVIIDLSMPELSGIDAIAELHRMLPGLAILVFTLHRSDVLLDEARAAGAQGYVCKSESEHLLPGLEAVLRRESYVSPGVSETRPYSSDEVWDRQALTARERQVVKLVAEGHSNKDIARLLEISVKTTETHRTSAMRKARTKTIAELTLYAARNRLVEL